MSYKVTTAPASEPLTATIVKNHLRIDDTASDTLIDIWIQAAREEAEQVTNRGLLPQTITEKFDSFPVATAANPQGHLFLSISPIRSVSSVTYTDTDGNSQTLTESTDFIVLDSEPPALGLVSGQSWPATYGQAHAVTVVYTVGYDDADDVPAIIKSSMLLAIAHWEQNREDTVYRLPTRAKDGLMKKRVMST